MALEIERKYLVVNQSYREMAIEKRQIAQGYLSTDPDKTVRVRIAGTKAFLTVKSRNQGDVRHEWEYEIPVSDAEEMLELCTGTVLAKWRYIVPFEGWTWEVDEYENNLSGLVVAEVEIDNPDRKVPLPSFAGEEVTGRPEYYNSTLAVRACGKA